MSSVTNMKIFSKYGKELYEGEADSLEQLVEEAVKLGVDLSNAQLNKLDFSYKNLEDGNFECAEFRDSKFIEANLKNANLSCAKFGDANLNRADLTNANLTYADLFTASLVNATLINANLRYVGLGHVNLSQANLSQIIGLNDNSKEFLSKLKLTRSGLYVYKAIGNTSYPLNPNWVIKPGAYLEETVNFNRANLCGCGVNFGTLEYVKQQYKNADYWLCLIEILDLPNVVVPFGTDGKARCSRLKLIKKIKK